MLLTVTFAALAVQAAVPAIADFSAVPSSPGSWRYTALATGSEASFVDATGTARLVVRCERATRLVSIARISTTAAPSLSIWSSSAARTLPASFQANSYRVTAQVSANDPLLDGMAFSRGRIAVAMAGAAPLVVPTWAEPARAVEDCRT